jgi:hypothetical protein
MAEDTRDFIERTQSLAEKRTGQRLSEDELAVGFSLYGPEKRVHILDTMDIDQQGELSIGDARDALGKFKVRQRLGAVHEALRKAGR